MANKKRNTSLQAEASYLDLFYMTPSEINAKDIAALLQDIKDLTTELWDEMNVLELELSNRNTIDFEPVEASFNDPSDAAFIKNRGIRTIFAVHLNASDLNIVIPYFELIVNQCCGFFCADSADFTPVYAGSSKK